MGRLVPGAASGSPSGMRRRLVTAGARARIRGGPLHRALAANRPALGFDIASGRSGGMRSAARRPRCAMAVTSPIQLVQDNRQRIGVLESSFRCAACAPTARAGARWPRRSVGEGGRDDRHRHPRPVPRGLVFQLTDPGAPAGRDVLYRSSGIGPGRPAHRAGGPRCGWATGTGCCRSMPPRPITMSSGPGMVWALGVAGAAAGAAAADPDARHDRADRGHPAPARRRPEGQRGPLYASSTTARCRWAVRRRRACAS